MTRTIYCAPRLGAALGLCLFAVSCAPISPGAPGARAANPAFVASFARAHDAGLAVYDALAPAFAPGAASPYAAVLGPEQMTGGDCAGRYAVAALQARCAALAAILAYNDARAAGAGPIADGLLGVARRNLSALAGTLGGVVGGGALGLNLAGELVASLRAPEPRAEPRAIRALIAALREDAPRLYRLERAARAERLLEADHRHLAALDQIFDVARGRSSPAKLGARRVFDRVTRRLAPILGRETPGYGAASLFDVMSDEGRPITRKEAQAMLPAIEAAEAALRDFDRVAGVWSDVAEAIRAYDGLLAELDGHLGRGDAASVVALRDRAAEIIVALRGS